MTISAWINSSSFPVDDATILSNHYHNGGQYLGFLLETTVDRGPRTLRFKLADECGRLVARYGATPLVVNRWYHVAGVYDAEARTLDVVLEWRTGRRLPARVGERFTAQFPRSHVDREKDRL